MEKNDMQCNDNILSIIMDIILKKHPIVDDRMEKLMHYPAPAMDIDLDFYQDNDNNSKTSIMFLDGNDSSKTSIDERIEIDNLISTKTINGLINEIYKDHDMISYIGIINNCIILTFTINWCDEMLKGIDCNEFKINLDFNNHPNCEELLNKYFKSIVTTFKDELKQTNWYIREAQRYYFTSKTQIINSLTEDELHEAIELLNNEDLCNILLKLPDNRFFEIYNEMKNKQKTLKKQ